MDVLCVSFFFVSSNDLEGVSSSKLAIYVMVYPSLPDCTAFSQSSTVLKLIKIPIRYQNAPEGTGLRCRNVDTGGIDLDAGAQLYRRYSRISNLATGILSRKTFI